MSSSSSSSRRGNMISLQAQATKLKDTDNALFAQRQLSRAVAAYSCALQAWHQDEEKQSQEQSDVLLYAVITSNRSAAYFELQNYHQAAVDASLCIDYLDALVRSQQKFAGSTLAHTPVIIMDAATEAKAIKMRDDVTWRRTRALVFAHDGCLHKAQTQLNDLEGKPPDEKKDDIPPPPPPLSSSPQRVPLLPRRLTPRESL